MSETLLRLTFRRDGVFNDPDGNTVTLPDGVKRFDTGETVLAGPVGMTRQAAGVYTLYVPDPAAGLIYQWTATWERNGVPTTVPFTSKGSLSTGDFYITESGGTGDGGAPATLDLSSSGNPASWATDALRFLGPDSSPAVGVVVTAYAKASYDAEPGSGLTDVTFTGNDGRWVGPLKLPSGTFYLIAQYTGDRTFTCEIQVP